LGNYLQALEDGIKIIKGDYGRYSYIIPCELCGRDIRRTQYSRKRNYICDYCKGVVNKKEKISLEHIVGIETPAEKRFNKAIENIKKQVKNYRAYEKAIGIAKTRAEKYGSIAEAMVAIELLKNKHRIIPQQKIGKYRVDFALPDLKLVIEVDGELYHSKGVDGKREGIIQLSLGPKWKIIHIPAELVVKNITKLEEAIKAVIIK